LPHSVITISIVTAILPMLSNHVIDKKAHLIQSELIRAIRLVGIFTVPSSIIFLLFGPLVTRTLFFGISNADARYLGLVLSGFAIGLVPLSINLIALRGLNAFENIKLQVFSNAVMNAFASALSFILAISLPAKWVTVGLAVALSISYYLGSWTTMRTLRRYEIQLHYGQFVGFYSRLTIAFSLIAIPTYFVSGHLPGGNIVRLFLVLVVSGLGYLGFAKMLRITEVNTAIALFKKLGRS